MLKKYILPAVVLAIALMFTACTGNGNNTSSPGGTASVGGTASAGASSESLTSEIASNVSSMVSGTESAVASVAK